jgi:hypothetical protein
MITGTYQIANEMFLFLENFRDLYFLDRRPLGPALLKEPRITEITSLQMYALKDADYRQKIEQDLNRARNPPRSNLPLQNGHKHRNKQQQVLDYIKQQLLLSPKQKKRYPSVRKDAI